MPSNLIAIHIYNELNKNNKKLDYIKINKNYNKWLNCIINYFK